MTNDLLHAYNEEFTFYDADDNEVPSHFACSICRRNVDDEPCPDHAPTTDLPGLRLIDCDATPKHWTWTHQREDYGLPCPWCLRDDAHAREAETRQCKHWGWRRSAAFRWLARQAYRWGVVSGTGTSTCDGCNWCVTLHWRGSRPYLLGVARETWRCWFKGHRRGDEVGFGFCGKCLPCPDCGSKTAEHDAGCDL